MGATILERFWAKVDYDPLTGCWNWNAGTDYKGYGNFHWKNGSIKAHRAAWYLLEEDGAELDPDSETLDHYMCGNTGCVRPMHMEVCGRDENSRRMWDERNRVLPSYADIYGKF